MRIEFVIKAVDSALHMLHLEYRSPDCPGAVAPITLPAPMRDGKLLEGAERDAVLVQNAPVWTLQRLHEVAGIPPEASQNLVGVAGGGTWSVTGETAPGAVVIPLEPIRA